jgi:micrococcal nuclease
MKIVNKIKKLYQKKNVEIMWDLYDNKTLLFSLENYETTAKCVNVYDGDTVKLVFPYQGQIYRWNCRLDGIDTPEMRTKIKKEKDLAIKGRDYLRGLILNKLVQVKCGEFDKYGRTLVRITYNGIDVNTSLVTNGYANLYDGGTKKIFVIN